ncbi:hypothetical protein D3C80_1920190 [compost metagenome]
MLACLALVGRQVATTAHQAIRHPGIHLGQLGDGRLMGKPAGAQEQNPLIQRASKTTDCLTQQTGALEAGQRCGDRVDEHRYHRAAVEAAQQLLQRLGKTVVNLHSV